MFAPNEENKGLIGHLPASHVVLPQSLMFWRVRMGKPNSRCHCHLERDPVTHCTHPGTSVACVRDPSEGFYLPTIGVFRCWQTVDSRSWISRTQRNDTEHLVCATFVNRKNADIENNLFLIWFAVLTVDTDATQTMPCVIDELIRSVHVFFLRMLTIYPHSWLTYFSK